MQYADKFLDVYYISKYMYGIKYKDQLHVPLKNEQALSSQICRKVYQIPKLD